MNTNIQRIDFKLPLKVSSQSQRQSYIFDLIFNEIIGIDYFLVDENYDSIHLSYGNPSGAIAIWSADYLTHSSLEIPVFTSGQFENKTFPFYTENKLFTFPFDVFSICFFAVSRQEELDRTALDLHQRFQAKNSWFYKNGWQTEPIVNYLSALLKTQIEEIFNINIPSKRTYTHEITIDIDNAFAYYGRSKSLLPSIIKSIIKGNIAEGLLKIKAAKNKLKDPFNTHDQLIKTIQKNNLNATIFFLMKAGGENANCNITEVEEIVKKYSIAGFELGIHPSYLSDEKDFIYEKELLTTYSAKEIVRSRHHFIRIHAHTDYPFLIEQGVKHEYSMGYASENGFRAGICQPYFWFDLDKNTKTNLLVHPFYFMDATYIFYTKKSEEDINTELQKIIGEVKKHKGELSFIIHNESLSNTGVYKGWGNFLDKIIELL